MANEATIINNPDNTPGLVSTGYQLQNTGFIAQRNGVDNTAINVNGTSQVDVEISGPVDVNGVLYSITTQATLTLSVTGRYCVYLNGSGDYLTPTLVLLSSTAFDDTKNARYYSGYRVLNWIIDFNSVTPETKVYRLVNANRTGIYANKMVVDDDLIVEDDLNVGGDTSIEGDLSVLWVGSTPVAGWLIDGTPYYIKEISVTIDNGFLIGSAAHGITNAYTNDRIFDAIPRRDTGSSYAIQYGQTDSVHVEVSWDDTDIYLIRTGTTTTYTWKTKIYYI